jgi:hypothetical protein
MVDLRNGPRAEARLDTEPPVVLVSAADFGAEIGTRSDPRSVYRLELSFSAPCGSRDSPVALLVTSLAANCLAARSVTNVFLRFDRSGSRHWTS